MQVAKDIFAINADLSEKCATIDRRGTKMNVESTFCRHSAGYICELKGDVDDDFGVPKACKVSFMFLNKCCTFST